MWSSITRRGWVAMLAGTVLVLGAGLVAVVRADTLPTFVPVDILGMGYLPREVTARPGDIVMWTSRDVFLHTVSADATNAVPGGPDSSRKHPAGMLPTDTYIWVVPSDAAPGTVFYYHCRFRGAPGDGSRMGEGMSGSVTVE